MPVYGEIILTIVRDYGSLPDFRTMPLSQLRFFYEGLRPTLKKQTEPKT